MVSPVGSNYNMVEILPETIDLKSAFLRLENETCKIKFSWDDEACGRFKNILCPSETALKVKISEFEKTLHANILELAGEKIICTQAPLFYTRELFWKSCLQHSNMIVDLTNPGDKEKEVIPYFPMEEGGAQSFQSVVVKCLEKQQLMAAPLIEAILYEVNDETQKKNIYRLHFHGWPDQGALKPEELNQLINFTKEIKQKLSEELPEIIHCRAGVGRTGTLAVGKALSKLIKQGMVNRNNLINVIDTLILEGRQARGPYFVQTEDQYKSIVLLGLSLIK